MSYRNGTRTEGRRLLPRARGDPQSWILLIKRVSSRAQIEAYAVTRYGFSCLQ